MIERDKEYYNKKISGLYSVIENQEKIIRDLQTEIFELNDRLSCANEELDLYKSVIDEVRECIQEQKFKVDNPTDYYFNCELIELHDLLEILDKVKGSDK